MKLRILIHAFVLSVAWIGLAQDAPPVGPDPREIPIPRIQGPLGKLPGVDRLPVRSEMPDVMLMNDGTKVTTRAQWEKRREEISERWLTMPWDKCLLRQAMFRARKSVRKLF
jgi:hypothetical protein